MNLDLATSSSLQDQLATTSSRSGQTTHSLREPGIVLAAIFILTLLLIGATYAIHRGLKQRRLRKTLPQPFPSSRTQADEHPSTHRRRRRRRSGRQLNPTLAETRGLPPKRVNNPDMPHSST